ncbi:hypothetical protein BGZ75_002408 [Mortierella antarctica]|nr:hypothetical protein BGZ75_002408 [Mortierella antarctica]
MALSNALYSIGYSSDDFLSGATGNSGDPASVSPKDDLQTTQEWELMDLPVPAPGPNRLVFIRNRNTQRYLSLQSPKGHPSPNDQVILVQDGQQLWELNETDQPGQFFIQVPQQQDNSGGVELIMDVLWVEDRLTVALQPKKDQDQTWTVVSD